MDGRFVNLILSNSLICSYSSFLPPMAVQVLAHDHIALVALHLEGHCGCSVCVRATDLLLFDQIYDCLGLLLSFDFDLHDMSSAANLYVP